MSSGMMSTPMELNSINTGPVYQNTPYSENLSTPVVQPVNTLQRYSQILSLAIQSVNSVFSGAISILHNGIMLNHELSELLQSFTIFKILFSVIGKICDILGIKFILDPGLSTRFALPSLIHHATDVAITAAVGYGIYKLLQHLRAVDQEQFVKRKKQDKSVSNPSSAAPLCTSQDTNTNISPQLGGTSSISPQGVYNASSPHISHSQYLSQAYPTQQSEMAYKHQLDSYTYPQQHTPMSHLNHPNVNLNMNNAYHNTNPPPSHEETQNILDLAWKGL